MDIVTAQCEMRTAHINGAAGVSVSGTIWTCAAIVALLSSPLASVLTLLIGGMLIYPLSLIVVKINGNIVSVSKHNPLNVTAMETTLLLIAGMALATWVAQYHIHQFFPVALVAIGVRYLLFQTIFGLKTYWILGSSLISLGAVGMVLVAPLWFFALIGGTVELTFGALLLVIVSKQATGQQRCPSSPGI